MPVQLPVRALLAGVVLATLVSGGHTALTMPERPAAAVPVLRAAPPSNDPAAPPSVPEIAGEPAERAAAEEPTTRYRCP